MLRYRKGENVEKEITKADLPFDDCMPNGQKDFLWMQVKGGTKVNNVITYAKDALEKGEYRTIVWSGSGGGLVKTVSCAEIIKRSFPLYQVTRMGYITTDEHWKPQMEGLEEIVARRQIPCLYILMSLDVIDIDGVQKPNTKTDFWHDDQPSTSEQARENNGQRRGQQQQQHSGRSKQKKKHRQQQDRQNPHEQDRQNPQQQDKQNPQQQQTQQQPPKQQQPKQQQQQQHRQQKQQEQKQHSPDVPSPSPKETSKLENSAKREKKQKKAAKPNNPEPMET